MGDQVICAHYTSIFSLGKRLRRPNLSIDTFYQQIALACFHQSLYT
ncbi:hypothetical protein VAE151_580009 [Vibrio aestuarianus]|uniref:Uncharacterized protein n=1 Tax=Vibrio aestuarianus TaxID=28171 RepID=A0ABN8TVC4_9VIBR|nr:hypothetical protein VAE308_1080011 [Vibrio aestuarianus]CAH8215918.1 hypothetical protein VAE032_300010 [Vibrio aestuarianus]CAH8216156.1 hypothetical protein VAE130_580131 [Vibrio aestuarianus]CAH8223758.1 hypothetical protein VAE142_910010 [Vibrio aestuarianus]CAH8227671.1 hypothetical protein VAE151_580009 [Vibrio aestuarianus]